MICENYLAPSKIDPKLLDAKFIFQQVEVQQQTSLDIFSHKKKPREREGYEEGSSILYKEMTVSEFVQNNDTVNILANYNKIIWDQDSSEIEKHPSTNEEIKELFKDLKLLGKRDVRDILKWKREIQKYFSSKEKSNEIKKEKVEKILTEEEREMLLDKELENQIRQQIQKKKRKLKKLREKSRKEQRKIDLNMLIPGDNIEQGEDQELFEAKKVNKDVFDDHNLPNIKLDNKPKKDVTDRYVSMEKLDYQEMIEDHFENLFRSANPKQLKRLERIKDNIKDNINLEDFSFEDSSEEIEGIEGEKIQNDLIVDFKEDIPLSTKSKVWFEQDIFDEVEDELDDKIAIQKMKQKYLVSQVLK